jgi:LacI family transcriptional regulator
MSDEVKRRRRPGEPPERMTLNHIAELADVSRATVSLVLRESPLVAADTRERVKAAMKSAGYVYNRGAARLRTGTSGTIGLVVPEITNPFYAELTAGIDEALDDAGQLTFLANSNESPDRQERFIQRIREQGADGIILCAAEGTPAALAATLARWRIPCVQILRKIGGARMDFVGPDYRNGMIIAVEHLIASGHTRIGFLYSAKKTSAARERLAGFHKSISARGLEPGPVEPCLSSRFDAAEIVCRMLSSAAAPTAIICHNDIMALGVVNGLSRLGLRPGVDVSVIGFDDIPESSNSFPSLSTVATGANEVGTRAAKLLLRRIAAPSAAPERILVAPRLIVRET